MKVSELVQILGKLDQDALVGVAVRFDADDEVELYEITDIDELESEDGQTAVAILVDLADEDDDEDEDFDDEDEEEDEAGADKAKS